VNVKTVHDLLDDRDGAEHQFVGDDAIGRIGNVDREAQAPVRAGNRLAAQDRVQLEIGLTRQVLGKPVVVAGDQYQPVGAAVIHQAAIGLRP
jgi:hypothetical protein